MMVLRILACACALLFAAAESAAADGWRIVQSAGPVQAGATGFAPAAVQTNQTLPADAWIQTGAAGRVVLARGLETIALGPNSRVQLPNEPVNGNTQVLQTLGSALFQVDKQKAPHFQVDTPYLAAIVKGTTFTVTVTPEGSSVDVTDGVVRVETPDGADADSVPAGFSAVVTRNDLGNVVVFGSGHDSPTPGGSGESHGKSDGASNDGGNNGKGSVISTVIGEAVLDIKEASGGLATSVDEPADSHSHGGGKIDAVLVVEDDSSQGGGKKDDVSLDDDGGDIIGEVDDLDDSGKGGGGGGGAGRDPGDLGDDAHEGPDGISETIDSGDLQGPPPKIKKIK